jgi:hypothetical protein
MPWDLMGPTPAVVEFCEKTSLKPDHILVPGCGLVLPNYCCYLYCTILCFLGP